MSYVTALPPTTALEAGDCVSAQPSSASMFNIGRKQAMTNTA